MTSTNATRHKRRESKAARRRKRLATGRKKFTQNELLAIKGEGVERLQHALDNAPKGFGKSKPRKPADVVSIGKSLVRRVTADERKGRAAA